MITVTYIYCQAFVGGNVFEKRSFKFLLGLDLIGMGNMIGSKYESVSF